MTVDPPIPPSGEAVRESVPAPPQHHWYHKISAIIFIVFCLELGTFLLIFPWSALWERNFFSSHWNNAFLRGAVSGLGVLNVYISLVEIFRLRRFARR